jgi:hypothetical protein
MIYVQRHARRIRQPNLVAETSGLLANGGTVR